MNLFQNTIDAVLAYEANQWLLADAVLADAGPPPKAFAKCVRFIAENAFEELICAYPDLDEPKKWAEYWRAAANFPDKAKRPKQISIAIKARDAETYETAVEIIKHGWGGKSRLDAKTFKFARDVLGHAEGRDRANQH